MDPYFPFALWVGPVTAKGGPEGVSPHQVDPVALAFASHRGAREMVYTFILFDFQVKGRLAQTIAA